MFKKLDQVKKGGGGYIGASISEKYVWRKYNRIEVLPILGAALCIYLSFGWYKHRDINWEIGVFLRQLTFVLFISFYGGGGVGVHSFWSEAEFLDEMGTKVSRVFLFATQSPLLTDLQSTSSSKSVLKPQVSWELSRLCPETSTKLSVHEFGFWKGRSKGDFSKVVGGRGEVRCDDICGG